jgi:hypothetical protein
MRPSPREQLVAKIRILTLAEGATSVGHPLLCGPQAAVGTNEAAFEVRGAHLPKIAEGGAASAGMAPAKQIKGRPSSRAVHIFEEHLLDPHRGLPISRGQWDNTNICKNR